jgi:MFS family permease
MNKIEKIYRMRRGILIWAFVCSFLIFGVLCFPVPFWLLLSGRPIWDHPINFLKTIFLIAGVLAVLLLLILMTRYFLFRASTLKEPALREAVDDERIRTNWLRAYRAAFLVMAGIHVIYLFSEYFNLNLGLLGLPNASWVSSSAGLSTFFGTAIFYTREAKNERA